MSDEQKLQFFRWFMNDYEGSVSMEDAFLIWKAAQQADQKEDI